jgi:hypothetical protein
MSQSMKRVLEWRERKCRLALARVTASVEKRRNGIQALDQFLSAVEAQISTTLLARSKGPCTVSTLAELEQHTKSLRAHREKLADMKRQAEHVLEELLTEQRQHAQQWRRCEARLAHVESIVRRERIQISTRAAEAEDEAYAEQRAMSRSEQHARQGASASQRTEIGADQRAKSSSEQCVEQFAVAGQRL